MYVCCRYEQEATKDADNPVCKRLMMILTLLHGEMLALRAIAEAEMEAFDEGDDE